MSISSFLKRMVTKITGGSGNVVNDVVTQVANAPKVHDVNISPLPTSVDELKQFDLTKPENTVALTIAALCMYPKDRDTCYAMLDYLKGPEDISEYEKQFIRDRFMDGVDYIPRSYFKGATPENDYQGQEGKLEVLEYANSYIDNNQNYRAYWVRSGGADGPREVRVRLKPSTGEWFVNLYEGLLPGIKTPVSRDKWA